MLSQSLLFQLARFTILAVTIKLQPPSARFALFVQPFACQVHEFVSCFVIGPPQR